MPLHYLIFNKRAESSVLWARFCFTSPLNIKYEMLQFEDLKLFSSGKVQEHFHEIDEPGGSDESQFQLVECCNCILDSTSFCTSQFNECAILFVFQTIYY